MNKSDSKVYFCNSKILNKHIYIYITSNNDLFLKYIFNLLVGSRLVLMFETFLVGSAVIKLSLL